MNKDKFFLIMQNRAGADYVATGYYAPHDVYHGEGASVIANIIWTMSIDKIK